MDTSVCHIRRGCIGSSDAGSVLYIGNSDLGPLGWERAVEKEEIYLEILVGRFLAHSARLLGWLRRRLGISIILNRKEYIFHQVGRSPIRFGADFTVLCTLVWLQWPYSRPQPWNRSALSSSQFCLCKLSKFSFCSNKGRASDCGPWIRVLVQSSL